jgi:NADP-dependent 3-hydroxy acid dehydrogenase YdfG
MQKAIIFAPANLLEDAMDLHLRGKSVLITGASKGIGAATAEAFAEEGSNVHLAARSTEAMRALAERLRAAHQVNVIAHTVDLRKSDDLHRLAHNTAGIDILVNNAGDIPGGSLEKVDEATWRHAWELKVFGYINLTRLVHADMKSRNSGVTSTSLARLVNASPMTTSQAALVTRR